MYKIKHQLSIHIDISPLPGLLEIRYSYNYSNPHALREQVIRIEQAEVDPKILEKIEDIIVDLKSRIPEPQAARLPHAEIVPKVRQAVTTILIQDQSARRTPHARMYYLEEIAELSSSIEQQVRMVPKDFEGKSLESWNKLKKKIKSIVWSDYKRLVGVHLFPE